MVSCYFILNCTGNVFEVLSKQENGYGSRSQGNDLEQATGSLIEKKEEAAKVWGRSEVVDEALRCIIYLYLDHFHSAMKNNVLYTGYLIWDGWVMYELQCAKLSKVLVFLPDSVAALFGIMNLKPLTRAVKRPDEQGQV